jgi:hypothetical protein
MLETVQSILKELASRYADRRVDLFDVKASTGAPGQIVLDGRVLDEAALAKLRSLIESCRLNETVDYRGVRILRRTPAQFVTVATNLAGLYAGPDWQAEMLSQLFYGWKLELLEEVGPWAFVRQFDGFLGWAFCPFLTQSPSPDPTHLVISPAAYVRTECPLGSPIAGRYLCGTSLQVVKWIGQCAEIDAQTWGWVTATDLRALDDLPRTTAERRALLSADAVRLTGVPYLRGGGSAMGIDSAGYSQLLHRLVGVRIPRDADLQFNAGRKIEPPFQVGDLLFLDESGQKQSATHVAVSLGDWRIIHSSLQRNGVYMDDVQDVPYLRDNFLGACSFL